MPITLYFIIFLFFLLQLTVALYNFYKKPYLKPFVEDSSRRVSILIPARNEAENLVNLLESLAMQTYNNFEIIVLDDNSEDDTYEIAKKYIPRFTDLKVIKGLPLPSGWTGKNYACAQLASRATGDYFLFLDADIVADKIMLSSLAHSMEKDNLALLSIVPQQKMLTLGEKSTVPLMNYMLLTLLPLPLIFEHEMPIFSAACGQVMCFEAASYKTHQYHSYLKSQIVEDLHAMRLVKKLNLKGRTLMADGLVRCRMYSSYRCAIQGFSKNFLGPFHDSIPIFISYVTIMVFGPLLIFFFTPLTIALSYLLTIGITCILTSKLSKQNIPSNLVLLPLLYINLFIIAVSTIFNRLSGQGTWKGRSVNSHKNLT